MGRDVEHRVFTREDRTRFRARLHRCADALARMLADARFDTGQPTTGLEIEFDLVDGAAQPTMRNTEVLQAISDPAFQTELGRFNVEINVPPTRLAGGFGPLEEHLRTLLNRAEHKAAEVDAHLVMIGILPTLQRGHLSIEAISDNPRYALLNEQILAARGEDVPIDIVGAERLEMTASSIVPEAACTSTQLHVQVTPDRFPAYWNAAQAVAGAQVAVGANSPYFCGRRLWSETRIALFSQAIDLRSEELKAQGVRPRVWFGERWIDSPLDLFEENTRYFPALLPVCEEEDPVGSLEGGGTPQLGELTLHNGTIYRWNRPVYGVVDGVPHLRVENRVLPSGPTVVDTLANAAFYFGLVRRLAEDPDPIWTRMSFDAAAANFTAGARDGLAAQLYWPELGNVGVPELVVRRLLPLARDGLASWGVQTAETDRLLQIVERRCLTGRNGAGWQQAVAARLADRPADRAEVLRAMLQRYVVHMHENTPVHTWPLETARHRVGSR